MLRVLTRMITTRLMLTRYLLSSSTILSNHSRIIEEAGSFRVMVKGQHFKKSLNCCRQFIYVRANSTGCILLNLNSIKIVEINLVF